MRPEPASQSIARMIVEELAAFVAVGLFVATLALWAGILGGSI